MQLFERGIRHAEITQRIVCSGTRSGPADHSADREGWRL